MWVLDVIHATSGAVETSFYLIAGEWSLGRKKCHFNFHADSSISRTHAVLRVGALTLEQLRDPQTRPALVLVDQNSRFGSFVNQEQCFSERELRHGDQITFGAKRTVLRVRYQVFVLVASRLHRTSRARVNDTCQRIGMHLIASESQDATHCLMEPGKIVATVKVLWALVYNQPVVTTPWIYAILERKSLSEPLPRCEQFMPTDETMPAVASNYLPNPMRKSMFHHHVVVFLAPQSMEELIAAMDGVALAAYKDTEHDDQLLREIEQHAQSRHVLVVEPTQSSGFSSGAASSDARDHGGATCNASVERRVDLFRSMGATFTTIQELAASVIFVKAPVASSECSFSSSLAGYNSNSMAAPIMSFPEHLSLHPRKSDDHDDGSSSEVEHDNDSNKNDPQQTSETPNAPETSSRVHESDTIPQPRANTKPRPPVQVALLASSDLVNESLQIKDEPSAPPTPQQRHSSLPLASVKRDTTGAADAPPAPLSAITRPKQKPLQLPDQSRSNADDDNSPPPSPAHTPSHDWRHQDDSRDTHTAGQWISARDLVPRPMKAGDHAVDMDHDTIETDAVQPLVVSCRLVVKRPRASQANHGTPGTCSGPNFKRFKKGNGYATRSTASLFPKQTVISVTVDSADRQALHQDMEVMEEQERIAEELFAMIEKRTARKRL